MNRILTYPDPRCIDKMEYWDEIKKYPHLCISQTLVQGLSHKYGRTEFNVLCTVDRFLKQFYKEWKDDSQNDIEQYIDMTNIIRSLEDDKMKKTFDFNRKDIYASLKFLFESEIKDQDINLENISNEEKKVLDIYEKLNSNNRWNKLSRLNEKDLENIKTSLMNILLDDIKKELGIEKCDININELKSKADQKLKELSENISMKKNKKFGAKRDTNKVLLDRILHYMNLIEDTNLSSIDCSKVVLHGVHQFTPLIYRLIRDLNKLNIEVIFMFNYLPKYKQVYKTWEKVYEWCKEDIEAYEYDTGYTYNNLGKNIGEVIEGNFFNLSELNKEITVFDNITSFTNYVAKKYDESEKELKTDMMEPSKILANMNEQFYAVSGEKANNLLKVYFPEQFGEKHFLSYPIGQFILGLYNMWDKKENKIIVNETSLRECLTVNLWGKKGCLTPLEIYEKVKLYFSDLNTLDEYIDRIDVQIKYLDRIEKEEKYKPFGRFSFYGIRIEEANYFRTIISDLKSITETLFQENDVNVGEHYSKLIQMIKKRTEGVKYSTEEEINLVNQIYTKLKGTSIEQVSSIDSIKETLHFYLQSSQNDNSANWIVRDFEQIDGGVLLADDTGKESWGKGAAYYHYAELSDNNFTKICNDILPWPLKETTFNKNNKTIEIVINSKREYGNFLKYMLFYGSYFLDKRLNISYIEENNDEKNEPYFILDMLGINKSKYSVTSQDNFINLIKEQTVPKLLDTSSIDEEIMNSFLFCPFRYLYEYILDDNQQFNSEFHASYYIKLVVAFKIRELNSKGGLKKSIEEHVKDFIKVFKLMFSFWKESDFIDIQNGIISILNGWVKSRAIKTNDEVYRLIREKYIQAKVGGSSGWFKRYNYRFNDKQFNKDKQELINFIKINDDSIYEIDKDRCMYCSYREECARVFLEEDIHG